MTLPNTWNGLQYVAEITTCLRIKPNQL